MLFDSIISLVSTIYKIVMLSIQSWSSPVRFQFLFEIEVYIFALLGRPVKVLPTGKCFVFTVSLLRDTIRPVASLSEKKTRSVAC